MKKLQNEEKMVTFKIPVGHIVKFIDLTDPNNPIKKEQIINVKSKLHPVKAIKEIKEINENITELAFISSEVKSSVYKIPVEEIITKFRDYEIKEENK